MLVRHRASHSTQPSMRCQERESNNRELAPLYWVNHSCSASRLYRLPAAAVIRIIADQLSSGH